MRTAISRTRAGRPFVTRRGAHRCQQRPQAVTPGASDAYIPPLDYVPSPLSPEDFVPQLVALGAIGLTTGYWWFVLVPAARVNLAVNKKSGRLAEYLAELKASDGRQLERFVFEKWLSKVDPETRYLLRGEEGESRVSLSETEGVSGAREGETLEDVVRAAKRTPDFFSFDNPVLVGASLSLGSAIVAGILTGR